MIKTTKIEVEDEAVILDRHLLKTFLDEIFGYRDSVLIENRELLAKIRAVDRDGSLCHIQYMDPVTKAPLITPRLWWKKDWDGEYSTQMEKKELSRREREERLIHADNITKIAEALSKMTGMKPEELRDTAYKMYKGAVRETLLAIGVQPLEDLPVYEDNNKG